MSVQIKIIYSENFEQCKVHSIGKDELSCLNYEDFFRIIKRTVGVFLSGVDKQNVRIQYRDDENTFIMMNDISDLKDALRCLTQVPNTDRVFRLCVRVHDQVTPVTKPLRKSINTTTEDHESSNRFVFDNPDDQCGKSRKRRLYFESRRVNT